MYAACDMAGFALDFSDYLLTVEFLGASQGFNVGESDEIGMDAVVVYCPEFGSVWGIVP